MSCYVSLNLGKQPWRPLPLQSQVAAHLVSNRAPEGAGERAAAGVGDERAAVCVGGERAAVDVGGERAAAVVCGGRAAAGLGGEREAAGVGGERAVAGVGSDVPACVDWMDEAEREGDGTEADGVESATSGMEEAPQGVGAVSMIGAASVERVVCVEQVLTEARVEVAEAGMGLVEKGAESAEVAVVGERRVDVDLEAAQKPAGFVLGSAALNTELGSSASVAQQAVSHAVSQPAQHTNSTHQTVHPSRWLIYRTLPPSSRSQLGLSFGPTPIPPDVPLPPQYCIPPLTYSTHHHHHHHSPT